MLKINEIIQAINGELLSGNPNKSITGISINSREVKEKQAFFCIKGDKFDGHDFIDDVIKKNVGCIISSKRIDKVDSSTAIILVKDTVIALGDLAKYYKSKFNIKAISIIGSCGKTTTKQITSKLISSKYSVLSNDKSFNNQIGVPLTIFKLRKHHQILINELGTNRPGDIKYLSKIVEPDVMIFTNIGDSHLEMLKSRAGVFKEKTSVLNYVKKNAVVIYNNDDQFLRKLSTSSQKHITYGIDNKSDLNARDIKLDKKLTFKLSNETFELNSLFYGNCYNALAAIACAKYFKISNALIKKSLKKVQLLENRFYVKKFNNLTIIDDTYNANPTSMMGAIDSLIHYQTKNTKIIICGDMLELGVKSINLHGCIGKKLNKSPINYIFCCGEKAKFIYKNIKDEKRAFYFESFDDQFKESLKNICLNKAVILVKGSRGMRLERIVEYLCALTLSV